jgi:hypothetical protein
MDMQQWITAINRAAATYSAAPLAAPVSSNTIFQRPTYPMSLGYMNTLFSPNVTHDSFRRFFDYGISMGSCMLTKISPQ